MPKPRKPGLTRMDAALDAMLSFGFPPAKVKRCVKELLQEYGGNEGWRFIEEDSYILLIEALLRDAEENHEGNVADVDNQSKEKSFDNGGAASTSTIVSDTQQDEIRENNVPADVATPSSVVAEPAPPELVGRSSRIHNEMGENVLPREGSWKGSRWYQTSGDIEKGTAKIVLKTAEDPKTKAQTTQQNTAIPASPSNVHRFQSPTNRPTPRRRPCYGWIDSEDESPDDFIHLKPAPMVPVLKKTPHAVVVSKSRTKRKSGWDVKPDDP